MQYQTFYKRNYCWSYSQQVSIRNCAEIEYSYYSENRFNTCWSVVTFNARNGDPTWLSKTSQFSTIWHNLSPTEWLCPVWEEI